MVYSVFVYVEKYRKNTYICLKKSPTDVDSMKISIKIAFYSKFIAYFLFYIKLNFFLKVLANNVFSNSAQNILIERQLIGFLSPISEK